MKKPSNITLFKVAPACSDCKCPMNEKGEASINVQEGNRISIHKVELYQCPKCLNTYIVEFEDC